MFIGQAVEQAEVAKAPDTHSLGLRHAGGLLREHGGGAASPGFASVSSVLQASTSDLQTERLPGKLCLDILSDFLHLYSAWPYTLLFLHSSALVC